MNRRMWPLALAGAALAAVACSRGEEREDEAAESAAQEQHERAQTERPLAPIDWKQVDAGLGRSGTLQPDGAYKVGMPRRDLHVTAAGVAVKPALALGSWVALKQVSDTEAMLMGDLVLLESEVGPVLAKLQEGGIEQTALHNHLLHESPRVMYMHIGGHGAPARLAAAVHAALALTTTPFGAPAAAALPASLGIDTAPRSARSSATTGRSTVACTRWLCRGRRGSRRTGSTSLPPWAWRRRSTSSRRVVGRRRLPAISS